MRVAAEICSLSAFLFFWTNSHMEWKMSRRMLAANYITDSIPSHRFSPMHAHYILLGIACGQQNVTFCKSAVASWHIASNELWNSSFPLEKFQALPCIIYLDLLLVAVLILHQNQQIQTHHQNQLFHTVEHLLVQVIYQHITYSLTLQAHISTHYWLLSNFSKQSIRFRCVTITGRNVFFTSWFKFISLTFI